MHVKQVDVVVLQAPQAFFDLVHHVITRGAAVIGAVANGDDEFGGDDKLVPTALERLAKSLFRSARGSASALRRINVRRVDVVDAQVLRRGYHAVDLVLRHDLGAEAIGAQPDNRYPHTGGA